MQRYVQQSCSACTPLYTSVCTPLYTYSTCVHAQSGSGVETVQLWRSYGWCSRHVTSRKHDATLHATKLRCVSIPWYFIILLPKWCCNVARSNSGVDTVQLLSCGWYCMRCCRHMMQHCAQQSCNVYIPWYYCITLLSKWCCNVSCCNSGVDTATLKLWVMLGTRLQAGHAPLCTTKPQHVYIPGTTLSFYFQNDVAYSNFG